MLSRVCVHVCACVCARVRVCVCACVCVCHRYTGEDKVLRDTFNALDVDGSGQVDQHELFEFLTGRPNVLRRRPIGDEEVIRKLRFVRHHGSPRYDTAIDEPWSVRELRQELQVGMAHRPANDSPWHNTMLLTPLGTPRPGIDSPWHTALLPTPLGTPPRHLLTLVWCIGTSSFSAVLLCPTTSADLFALLNLHIGHADRQPAATYQAPNGVGP